MDDRYFWSNESPVNLEDWLKKTRPSIITDHQTPWIWLKGTTTIAEDPERSAHGEALIKAKVVLDRLAKRLEEIQQDESIPVRGKKGVKSKKQCKDESHDIAREELEELSKETKWTIGKWLLFPRQTDVDRIWSTLARSVVSGPLKSAGVDLIKVAPAPKSVSEGDAPTHVLCVYMDDVYDKAAVTKVLSAILEHDLEPSACKSDLYTLAGIDSKHPTGLRSSIWRPTELIEGSAIKAIKDAARGSVKRSDGILESDSEDERVAQAMKRKKETDPKPPIVKKGKSAGKSAAIRYQEEDIFAPAEDSD